jgi:hypothetical protein
MSIDKIRQDIIGNTLRDINPELHKSPEQRQSEWNQISMRNLQREQGKNIISVITERIQKLEAGLKEGEALVVYCDAGRDRLILKEIEFPTWNLAIMSGTDENGNYTHRLEGVQDVKLTCKVMASTKKSAPIGFALPEAKA